VRRHFHLVEAVACCLLESVKGKERFGEVAMLSLLPQYQIISPEYASAETSMMK
jgi:hypothetical protein